MLKNRNYNFTQGLYNYQVHGYWRVITGNMVTILKVGDKVKQGQVIGRVGNTGLSGCPHLHFELKSGASDCARSFPCFFTNIKEKFGNLIDIITEEYTIVNAE